MNTTPFHLARTALPLAVSPCFAEEVGPDVRLRRHACQIEAANRVRDSSDFDSVVS